MLATLILALGATSGIQDQPVSNLGKRYIALRSELKVSASPISRTDPSRTATYLSESRFCEVVGNLREVAVVEAEYTTFRFAQEAGSKDELTSLKVHPDRIASEAAKLAGKRVRLLLQRYSANERDLIVKIVAAVAESDYVAASSSNLKAAAPSTSQSRTNPRQIVGGRIVLGKLAQALKETQITSSKSPNARAYYTAKPFEYLVIVSDSKDGWSAVLLENGKHGYVLTNTIKMLPFDVTKPLEGTSGVGSRKPIVISAAALAETFARNELAARDKYLGKELKVTGTIEKIAEAWDGTLYIALRGSRKFALHVYFDDSWRADLKKLRVGRTVTVRAYMTSVHPVTINLIGALK